MKKFIIGLIGVIFASVMALSLSSCGKEEVEVEPEKGEDEVTIFGTWRHYADKAKGYYEQITLEEDGTLIWRGINENEDETSYDTYTYENGYITWYCRGAIEAIWKVYILEKSTMATYHVDKETGDYGITIVWSRVE